MLTIITMHKKTTDYKPTHGIDEGLEESIKWYIENLK